MIKIKILGMLSLLMIYNLFSTAHAVQFYDIARPGIKRIKLHVQTVDKSASNTAFMDHLKRQMTSSLFFEIADSNSAAEYVIELDNTVESGSVKISLESNTDSGFEKFDFGISFKKTKDNYLKQKSAQVANLMLKEFFGVKGSMGSPIIYSSQNTYKKNQVKSLFLRKFGDIDETQISKNLYSNYGASWDPSGKKILFTAVAASGTKVLMQQFRPLRIRSVPVYSDKGKGSAATWGSNGRIYVAKFVKRENTDIYEYKLDGEKLYATPAPKIREIRRVTKSAAIETEPALSPNRKQLALISNRTGSPQVYIQDIDGKKLKRITQNGPNNQSPSWSPGGRYLAYSGLRDKIFSIFRMDLKTKEETMVTPLNISAQDPTWSPDGSLIAFSGREKGSADWKVYYILSSGGDFHRLTKSRSGVHETSPSWGPGLR